MKNNIQVMALVKDIISYSPEYTSVSNFLKILAYDKTINIINIFKDIRSTIIIHNYGDPIYSIINDNIYLLYMTHIMYQIKFDTISINNLYRFINKKNVEIEMNIICKFFRHARISPASTYIMHIQHIFDRLNRLNKKYEMRIEINKIIDYVSKLKIFNKIEIINNFIKITSGIKLLDENNFTHESLDPFYMNRTVVSRDLFGQNIINKNSHKTEHDKGFTKNIQKIKTSELNKNIIELPIYDMNFEEISEIYDDNNNNTSIKNWSDIVDECN